MAWHGMTKTKKMGREVKLNGIQLGRKSSECAPLVAPRGRGPRMGDTGAGVFGSA